jgi:hypothetical protein
MIFGGMTADVGVYLAHVPCLPRPRKRGNAPGVGDPLGLASEAALHGYRKWS